MLHSFWSTPLLGTGHFCSPSKKCVSKSIGPNGPKWYKNTFHTGWSGFHPRQFTPLPIEGSQPISHVGPILINFISQTEVIKGKGHQLWWNWYCAADFSWFQLFFGCKMLQNGLKMTIFSIISIIIIFQIICYTFRGS